MGPHIVDDDGNESIANIFCFGAFADKNSGIVYHNLTGSFPFMLFYGSVCFFVLSHYESNAILATPIVGLDDVSIFNAYKKYFEDLTVKGFKPKLNVMDNQATKHIKKILTENDCKLQMVKPHNHRVNAAEQAIQTFKAAFIAALATTDSDFPLRLWDRLTPRLKTHSTCYEGHESTRQNHSTKYSTDHTIGSIIPLHHWDARLSYMKTVTRADHGLPKAWMHSTLAQ
jgi:hypothetical protein